jgi:hypothetical protein
MPNTNIKHLKFKYLSTPSLPLNAIWAYALLYSKK